MLDNGLLQYYKTLADKKGWLQLKDVPQLSAMGEDFPGVYQYVLGGKGFYCKEGNKKTTLDAEILISQLYPSLGVPSAVYTPVVRRYENAQAVISNDVEAENCKLAYNKRELLAIISFFPECITNHITRSCVKQIATMSALDLATCNIDRHSANFFFKYDEHKRAESIVTIDHGYTTPVFYDHEDKNELSFRCCFNNGERLFRQEALKDLKTSESVLEVTSPAELAETVGRGIDLIPQTAEDIKQTIGYEVDPKYVSALQKSFEQTAEELEQ